MRRIVIGILAHVDAGKTTLSEAMLYCTGAIRTFGRVDHGDAFLDTFELERRRGITIFSKQAVMELRDTRITLLDTPGHADFSAEMERTLDVLDAAALVISAPAGVQSHTRTVWKLLRARGIPTFIFVNKMDQPGTDRQSVMRGLVRDLGERVFDIESFDEESLALSDDVLLAEYTESGSVSDDALASAISEGRVFPCWFGSALKLEGVEKFVRALAEYVSPALDRGAPSARVFKITRDERGARLTHMKVTGGAYRVRDVLSGPDWEEKITQMRVYSGAGYTAVQEAVCGDVVAVTGLSRTCPGMGIGDEPAGTRPVLEPVLRYRAVLQEGYDAVKALGMFRKLEEEDPQLRVDWDETHGEIGVRLMGPVQLEVLSQVLMDRYGLDVSFDRGSIIYRETISAPIEGVGHYEPLRHYAEVHLLLEPGERGSGLKFYTDCPEDILDRNWQRLILTHLAEKRHVGVLTGSPVTDMSITLVSGRAHEKHTEGGDFRQATYRAVRQGLMSAKSVLLEPWYDFVLELPQSSVGRAMTDLGRMGADCAPDSTDGEFSVLKGRAPVAVIRDYPQEVVAYTHGLGRFSFSFCGYEPCTDADSVIESIGYDADGDTENPADSVFCSHGAGYNVKWYDVPKHMHIPFLRNAEEERGDSEPAARRYGDYERMAATDKELMAIFERTYGPVKRDEYTAMRKEPPQPAAKPYKAQPRAEGPEYVLVDGYNVIFAWDELRKLAENSLELARARLIDMLRNYQGIRQSPVIVVFDAYKVKGNPGSIERDGDFAVVYTKEAETADMYIEKVTRELGKKHRVRVATSDMLEQVIVLGHGTLRVSSQSFEVEVREVLGAIDKFIREQD